MFYIEARKKVHTSFLKCIYFLCQKIIKVGSNREILKVY